MKKIAAFNWKLKPTLLSDAKDTIRAHKKWAKKYPTVQVVSAPPMPFIHKLISDTSPLGLAGQTISSSIDGAHTGQSSAVMLKQVGCSYVIVGHSERRTEFGVTDEMISEKALIAIEQGLTPIVCFGESERDEKGAYIDVLTEQVQGALALIPEKYATKIVLAYEPVWAIGKDAKRPMNTEELFSTIVLIKKILVDLYGERRGKKIQILYGGSVKSTNAEELAAVPGVSGFLVGGASHHPDQVHSIIASLS